MEHKRRGYRRAMRSSKSAFILVVICIGFPLSSLWPNYFSPNEPNSTRSVALGLVPGVQSLTETKRSANYEICTNEPNFLSSSRPKGSSLFPFYFYLLPWFCQTNPILNISPGGKNHFLQNKPNFQNVKNALTPFPIAGCWKLAAGS